MTARSTAVLFSAMLLTGTAASGAEPPGDPGSHWAFQAVANPAPPKVSLGEWPRGDIDRFTLARMEAAGLAPSAEADRRTLARRLYFDLHGLPPSYEEVRAFAEDEDPAAYEKLVDRLLASPRFGERWGRHWLDVARYSDTKGYVFRESREYPYAYTYRDWAIRAFNDDLPYDKFLLYQIAADKAIGEGGDQRHLAAMGFLTVGRRFLNREPDIIDDRIDVTFRGAMALTVACSRCHDHKYDPIPIGDYYSLYGVFASSEEPKQLPSIPGGGRTAETDSFEKGLGQREKKLHDYRAARVADLAKPEFIAKYLLAAQRGIGMDGESFVKLTNERKLFNQIALRWRSKLEATKKSHDPVFAAWHKLAALPAEGFKEKAAAAWAELKAGDAPVNPEVRAAIDKAPPESLGALAGVYGYVLAGQQPAFASIRNGKDAPLAVNVGNVDHVLDTKGREKIAELTKAVEDFKASHPGAPPRAMVMFDRAKPREPQIFERGDPGRRGARVPRQFLEMLKGAERKPFTDGSGRLEMAQEITSADNPLTARVWVNRVWGHLFGSHLVSTPSDFGLRCDPPTHPMILDHLATRFVEDGWSSKQLIRSIVLSATYRQASAAAGERDPENRLLSHANRRRVDFESLRDGMLFAAGQLDLKTFGRPVEISGANYSKRRTVYGRVERQNLPPVFRTFDFANPDVHIPKRLETTVPQQALFMLNGKFAQDQAAALMSHPGQSKAMKDDDRIRFLYRRIFARNPDPEELADGLAFVSPPPPAEPSGKWTYGHGRFDKASGKLQFTPLPHFTGKAWQGGGKLPDPRLGWVTINAGGGHPGNPNHAAILRWSAPHDGRFEVRTNLLVPNEKSDGVFAAVFKGLDQKLGSWKAAATKDTPILVESIPLKAGEQLHLVVACGPAESFDSFRWNPVLRDLSTGKSWSAAEDINRTPAKPSMPLWEQYAQALLSSNEFAFID